MTSTRRVLKYVGLITFLYILLLAIDHSRNDIQPIFTIIIGLLVYWVSKKLIGFTNRSERNLRIVVIGILIFGMTIRILWILLVPTSPISDFEFYHTSAIKFSQGIFEGDLPKNLGYPLLLSIFYRIYPAPITGMLVNVIASTFSIGLIYLIGLSLAGPSVGIIASLLFAAFPSEINMVSVLGTEVLTTTILLLITFLFLRGIKPTQDLKYIFIIGLLSGLGFIMRSSLIFYLPGIVLVLVLVRSNKGKPLIVFFFGLFSFLVIFVIGYSISIGKFSMAPITTQESFPFLSGTNIKSSGMWSQEDASLYFSWPSSERDKLARQEAIERIRSDPGGFLLLIPQKFSRLMGENDYGNNWSIHPTESQQWPSLLSKKSALAINGLISQSFYVVIIGLAFFSYTEKSISTISLLALMMVLLTMLPHIILEVQPRYHHYILPFIILAASSGLLMLINRTTKSPIEIS